MSKIQELFAKVTRRQQQQSAAKLDSVKSLIVALAEQELGHAGRKLDIESAADLLENAGLSEAELRENVELYKQRVRWATLAAKQTELLQTADRLAAEVRAAGEAETARRKAEDETIERLRTAASAASAEYLAAVDADADLQTTCQPFAYSPALNEQLASVNAALAETRQKLSPTGQPGISHFNQWPSIHKEPAMLVAHTRRALEGDRITPERRAQLESQQAAAEKSVERARAELADLEQQREQIISQMTAPQDAHLRPENFALIRHPRAKVEAGA